MDNVLVSKDGKKIKVSDFGLMAQYTRGNGSVITVNTIPGVSGFGTPGYISPEQAKGEIVDVRSDLFSVGATLYWLFTSNYPAKIKGDEIDVLAAARNRPKESLPDQPELEDALFNLPKKKLSYLARKLGLGKEKELRMLYSLTSIVAKCMKTEPDKRYAFPQQFIDDLDLLMKGKVPENVPSFDDVYPEPRGPDFSVHYPLWKRVAAYAIAGALVLGSCIAVDTKVPGKAYDFYKELVGKVTE
jgi:serine/threonine protein kinase